MNIAAFDLNLLKVLDALLRDGSTTAAARRVGLSQPAVSAALGRLRHAIGDELFVRSGQGLVPTDIALSLEAEVRAVLGAADRILAGPGALDPSRLNRHFRICAGDYITDVCLPPVMRRLAAEAPMVRVSVLDEIFRNSIDRMRTESFDLLVLPQFGFPDYLESQVVFRSEFVIGARKGHPRLSRAGIAPGGTIPLDLYCDMPQARFGVESGSIEEDGIEDENLARIGRARTIQMAVPTFGNLVAILSGTDLTAVLPRRIGERAAALGLIDTYGAPHPMPPLPICMVWHRRQSGSPVHRWFRDLFAAEAAKVHPDPVEQPEAHG